MQPSLGIAFTVDAVASNGPLTKRIDPVGVDGCAVASARKIESFCHQPATDQFIHGLGSGRVNDTNARNSHQTGFASRGRAVMS